MDAQTPHAPRRLIQPGHEARRLDDLRVMPRRLVRAIEEILMLDECWKLRGTKPPRRLH
jgi:hypothetical protein